MAQLWHDRGKLPGYRIVKQSQYLRHFTAELQPLGAMAKREVA